MKDKEMKNPILKELDDDTLDKVSGGTDGKICTNCGEIIPGGHVCCPNCGKQYLAIVQPWPH